jgi:serine/threonine-protein kinase
MARTVLVRGLVLMLALVPVTANAEELFGAFAYSVKEKKHGWAVNFPTKEAAEQAALEHCQKNAETCQNILWFRNACGALVTGPEGFAAEWAEDQTNAVNKALKACATRSASCAVTATYCTAKQK